MNGRPSSLADVVDRADVGVIQRRRGTCLALEALEGLVVFGEILGKELQGDGAIEPSVERPEDLAHTAATEPLGDTVVPDRCARFHPLRHRTSIARGVRRPHNRWTSWRTQRPENFER